MNPTVSIFTPDHKKTHRDSTGSGQDGVVMGSKSSTPLPRSPGEFLINSFERDNLLFRAVVVNAE